jgi:hypothetical protein
LSKNYNEFFFKFKKINYRGIWAKVLVFLESPQWVGFNERDLKILRYKVRKMLDFE